MQHRVNRRQFARFCTTSGAAALLMPSGALADRVSDSHRLGLCSISYALRWPALQRGQGTGDEFRQLVDHCRAIGAAGIQSNLPSDGSAGAELRSQMERASLYFEAQIGLPHTESDIDLFEGRVRLAKEAGATTIRTACLGGRRYEVFKDAAGFAEFARRAEQSLLLAERVVRKHRVRLAVENHKDWRIPEMLNLLKRIGSEWVGVCVDTGNSIALLEDPAAVVRAFAPFAMATHLKDMAVQESEKGFLLAEVALGEGFLDLRSIVETLRQSNPKLQFSLEMITRDPLEVPCLTRPYWATFEDMPAWVLAGALSMVRGNASKKPLPRISALGQAEKLELEDQAVKRSLAFAAKELQL